jgi:hypothetical protein
MNQQLPPLPWHGGCQCGAVRYKISAMPLTLYACHCTQCQKQSASAHGLSMWVEKSAFAITGPLKTWSRKADSGNTLHCHFCGNCGSRLWHEAEEPDADLGAVISLKAGSLDIAGWLVPVAHIWTGSKQAGTIIPEGRFYCEGEPPDDQLLLDAWRKWQSS